MPKCKFNHDVIVKPNGKDSLDPCPYHLKEIHYNVNVKVLQCPICGHIELMWDRTPETEDEIIEPLDEKTDEE